MGWIELPGEVGKLYIPETPATAKKKHDCADCFCCQMCSDSRCSLCQSKRKRCDQRQEEKDQR